MSVISRIHNDMKPIIPAVGGRQTPCSVAFRKSATGRHGLVISLSKQTAQALSFNVTDDKAKNYAEIGFDGRTGTLVVANVSEPGLPTSSVLRWKARSSKGTLVFIIRPDWLDADAVGTRAAERCEFSIQEEIVDRVKVCYIEITVPSWCAPQRTAAKVLVTEKPTRLLDGVAHIRPGVAR